MGRKPLEFIALHHADGGRSQGVTRQEHECFGKADNRKRCATAVLAGCAGHSLEREGNQVWDDRANVDPHFGGDFAQQVHLAMVNNQSNKGIRRPVFGPIQARCGQGRSKVSHRPVLGVGFVVGHIVVHRIDHGGPLPITVGRGQGHKRVGSHNVIVAVHTIDQVGRQPLGGHHVVRN